jgi:foldase protein PrsA
LLALGAFFVLAASVAACGSGVPGNSVADVAGNPITYAAWNHWMYVAEKGNTANSPGAPVIVPTDPPGFSRCIAQARKAVPALKKSPDKTLRSQCKALFTSLNQQVMSFLITAYWYQLEANRLHFHISSAQVASMFAAQRKQAFPNSSGYTAFLAETGQTQADLLFRVRVQALLKKLLALHNTSITSASIAAYYKSHSSEFGTPASRNLKLVRTNTLKQANAARSALQHGQSWCKVTKQYSVDPSKSSCGALTNVTSGQEEHVLNAAAFSAPQGKLEGPLHGTFGYYVFEVTKITNGSVESLAKATPTIRSILQNQATTSAQSAVNKVASQHWKAKTNCLSTYAINFCKGYKAPKTASATPGTSTPPPSSSSGTTSSGSSSGTTSGGTSTK